MWRVSRFGRGNMGQISGIICTTLLLMLRCCAKLKRVTKMYSWKGNLSLTSWWTYDPSIFASQWKSKGWFGPRLQHHHSRNSIAGWMTLFSNPNSCFMQGVIWMTWYKHIQSLGNWRALDCHWEQMWQRSIGVIFILGCFWSKTPSGRV